MNRWDLADHLVVWGRCRCGWVLVGGRGSWAGMAATVRHYRGAGR